MKNSILCTLFFLAATLHLAQSQTGCTNLITNGNFSQGNDGSFTSALAFSGNTCTSVNCQAGGYCVGPAFSDKCNLWPGTFDHTVGTPAGSFMSVDGMPNGSGPIDVWKTTGIGVVPGRTYKFCFWVKSVYACGQQSLDLDVVIDDNDPATVQPVISHHTICQTPVDWQLVTVLWPAPLGATTVDLTIRQVSPGLFRDFGLDDICFVCTECCDNFYNSLSSSFFTVQPAPTAPTFSFTKPSGTPLSDILNWDFGDNQYSIAPNPTHTYTTPGNYIANLWISRVQPDGDTCTVKLSQLVEVPACPNLIPNGNFSAGNDGSFTSALAFSGNACGGSDCQAGAYCVSNNFQGKCSTWPFSYDKTVGTAAGSFMSIDGKPGGTGNVDVWKSNTTINVTAGTTYKFSFWVKSVYTANQQTLNLRFFIDGNGTPNPAPVITNILPPISQTSIHWQQVSTLWACPIGVTSVVLAIRQVSSGAFRDFGIDDIDFRCVDCADFMTDAIDYGIGVTSVSGNTYNFCVSPNIATTDIVQWNVDCNNTIEATSNPCATITLATGNSTICATILHPMPNGDTCKVKVNTCLPAVQDSCTCQSPVFDNEVNAGFTFVENTPYTMTFTPVSLLNNCDVVSWTFGNGAATGSSVGTASITYTYPSTPGTYIVCMKVTRTTPSGVKCKKTICITITVDGMFPGLAPEEEDGGNATFGTEGLMVKPNPVTREVSISIPGSFVTSDNFIRISTPEGIELKTMSVHSSEMNMDLDMLPSGIYWISLNDSSGKMLVQPAKIVKQ